MLVYSSMLSHCRVADAMTTCSVNIFPIQLNAWLSLPARDSLKKRKKSFCYQLSLFFLWRFKKSQLFMHLPARLVLPCLMLHVDVVSGCFVDSLGSCLDLIFIGKHLRPPTHGLYLQPWWLCVLHSWLLLSVAVVQPVAHCFVSYSNNRSM